MLALNTGMRDAEIKTLTWDRLDLQKRYLAVSRSKTEAGEGRTIPLNSTLYDALAAYSDWYILRFGELRPEWYVFPFGRPRPNDPTRPVTTLKTAWRNLRKKANVTGRWHYNRHTLIADLAESGASDQTIILKTAVDRQRGRQVLDLLRFSTAAYFTKWVTTAFASNSCG